MWFQPLEITKRRHQSIQGGRTATEVLSTASRVSARILGLAFGLSGRVTITRIIRC